MSYNKKIPQGDGGGRYENDDDFTIAEESGTSSSPSDYTDEEDSGSEEVQPKFPSVRRGRKPKTEEEGSGSQPKRNTRQQDKTKKRINAKPKDDNVPSSKGDKVRRGRPTKVLKNKTETDLESYTIGIEENTFLCSNCNKQFPTKVTLNSHLYWCASKRITRSRGSGSQSKKPTTNSQQKKSTKKRAQKEIITQEGKENEENVSNSNEQIIDSFEYETVEQGTGHPSQMDPEWAESTEESDYETKLNSELMPVTIGSNYSEQEYVEVADEEQSDDYYEIPVSCPNCKMTYRNVISLQKHVASCMYISSSYSSDDEEQNTRSENIEECNYDDIPEPSSCLQSSSSSVIQSTDLNMESSLVNQQYSLNTQKLSYPHISVVENNLTNYENLTTTSLKPQAVYPVIENTYLEPQHIPSLQPESTFSLSNSTSQILNKSISQPQYFHQQYNTPNDTGFLKQALSSDVSVTTTTNSVVSSVSSIMPQYSQILLEQTNSSNSLENDESRKSLAQNLNFAQPSDVTTSSPLLPYYQTTVPTDRFQSIPTGSQNNSIDYNKLELEASNIYKPSQSSIQSSQVNSVLTQRSQQPFPSALHTVEQLNSSYNTSIDPLKPYETSQVNQNQNTSSPYVGTHPNVSLQMISNQSDVRPITSLDTKTENVSNYGQLEPSVQAIQQNNLQIPHQAQKYQTITFQVENGQFYRVNVPIPLPHQPYSSGSVAIKQIQPTWKNSLSQFPQIQPQLSQQEISQHQPSLLHGEQSNASSPQKDSPLINANQQLQLQQQLLTHNHFQSQQQLSRVRSVPHPSLIQGHSTSNLYSPNIQSERQIQPQQHLNPQTSSYFHSPIQQSLNQQGTSTMQFGQFQRLPIGNVLNQQQQQQFAPQVSFQTSAQSQQHIRNPYQLQYPGQNQISTTYNNNPFQLPQSHPQYLQMQAIQQQLQMQAAQLQYQEQIKNIPDVSKYVGFQESQITPHHIQQFPQVNDSNISQGQQYQLSSNELAQIQNQGALQPLISNQENIPQPENNFSMIQNQMEKLPTPFGLTSSNSSNNETLGINKSEQIPVLMTPLNQNSIEIPLTNESHQQNNSAFNISRLEQNPKQNMTASAFSQLSSNPISTPYQIIQGPDGTAYVLMTSTVNSPSQLNPNTVAEGVTQQNIHRNVQDFVNSALTSQTNSNLQNSSPSNAHGLSTNLSTPCISNITSAQPCPCPRCLLRTATNSVTVPDKYRKVLPSPRPIEPKIQPGENYSIATNSTCTGPAPMFVKTYMRRNNTLNKTIKTQLANMIMEKQGMNPAASVPEQTLLQIEETDDAVSNLDVASSSQNLRKNPVLTAVVRPMEHPLQKMSDQISQIESTFSATPPLAQVRPSEEIPVSDGLEASIRKDPPEQFVEVNNTVTYNQIPILSDVEQGSSSSSTVRVPTTPTRTIIKRKAETPGSGSPAKSIKVTLKRKEGGDSYSINDVSETGASSTGTMRSLKIKAKITSGEFAGTSTDVVVEPKIHIVPIPDPDADNLDSNLTIAENDLPIVHPVLSVSDAPPKAESSNFGASKLTHRAVVVYEVKCNNTILFRSSNVRAVWAHIFETVQGTRLNHNLPPLSYPATNISLENRQEPTTTFNMGGLVHRAVQFLLQHLPKKKSEPDKHQFQFHETPVSTNDEQLLANETGCARTEGYAGRKPFDMFGWLASKHRKPLEKIHTPEDVWKNNAPIALRFRTMKEKSKNTLMVMWSTIHGRGLYTSRSIEKGEMIIEYAGEVIRSLICDQREKYYETKSIGCYMFRIDDEYVIDATMKGNAARFINHSCEPNCESKSLKLMEKDRIMIFALRRISSGEELTYDYKFEKEEDKIPCLCSSSKCRKYLN